MESYIAIMAHNGATVIDETPEAEIRFSNMKYLEERWNREEKRNLQNRRNLKNIFKKWEMFKLQTLH